ncbi:MAG: sulfatase [Planctomycetia bacterium]|nr:sulfatase [Planctomycetia bacterium]
MAIVLCQTSETAVRQHSKTIVLAGWLALAATIQAGAAGEPPKGQPPAAQDAKTATPRPNVLFLAIDDLNDWVGYLGGHPQAKTPNLDRLAKRGVAFTRAYCAAPACNPSRTALLCGVRPSTSGVYHNSQPWRPVLADAVTLPQHFMAHGYHVVGGGKIFHGGYPDKASWHEYFNDKKGPSPRKLPANGIEGTAHFDWGPVDAEDDTMADAKTVAWAIDYLAKDHREPYFLAVGLYKPHLPWYVPRKYFDELPLERIKLPAVTADDLADVPAAGRKMAKPDGDHRHVVESHNWERGVQGYLATIAFMDGQVGRLLDALDRTPDGRRTIIVMWSDHGWHLGQKEHWRKFALWEEATRMPLAIVAPGVTTPGTRCDRTVSLLDLYPTLIELCGLSAKPGLEGTSLVPLLKDPAAPWDHPALTTHGRGHHAVRSERWRYIRYADGAEELYDHQSDPHEWTNLAGDARHAAIKAELARWLPKTDAPDAPSGKKGGEE